MHVPITLAVLAAISAALLLLRRRWGRLRQKTRSALVLLGFLLVGLSLVSPVSGWSTWSLRLNACLLWAGLIGYLLLLLRFSLIPPRGLTSVIAAVLFVPTLAASSLLPLTLLFDQSRRERATVAGHLSTEKVFWETGVNADPGVDLLVYRTSEHLPFLRRRLSVSTFHYSQCNAAAAFARLEPERHGVLIRCPAWNSPEHDGDRDWLLPLR